MNEMKGIDMSKYKLYTKKGDDGTTGLLSGKRVGKHHIRIKAYGTVDELNAWVGMIRNFKTDKNTDKTLVKIQQELMIIASQLADDTAFEVSKLVKVLEPFGEEEVNIWKIKSTRSIMSYRNLKTLSFQEDIWRSLTFGSLYSEELKGSQPN